MNIVLSLGSNIGNRFEHIRSAITEISKIATVKTESVVFETKAILPNNAPDSWNIPYLNMVLVCDTNLHPHDLLNALQGIEAKLGRPINHEKWGPRAIDIDILFYGNAKISDDNLTIPHPEINNRPFLKMLLNTVGFNFNDDTTNCYTPQNSFVLSPKIVGVLNITPDSFSDGGKYLNPENASNKITELRNDGANIIELGAQSTRPGYQEISAQEEINRLERVLEGYDRVNDLGIDSYFDEVIRYALKKGVKWINDIHGEISDSTIKLISDHNAILVMMLQGMNIDWLASRGKYLENLGLQKQNIVLDPGLGFQKTKIDNFRMLGMLNKIKEFGYPVLVGHSRKSFISLFSNAFAPDRDIETIAISSYLQDLNVDYIRIHNVKDHMKYLVTKRIIDSLRK